MGGGGGGGGARLRIFFWGGGARGGPNSKQEHDVVTTSMRRNDVTSTSFRRRRVPTRFLINQCQIITFLILKYDIENSRIEMRGIVLPVQVGGLLGGQRVCWPPSQIIGGAAPLPPSSYAYGKVQDLHLLPIPQYPALLNTKSYGKWSPGSSVG